MKTLFRIMAFFLMLGSLSACSNDEEPVIPTLEVTYANLDGTWKLVEWNGEAPSSGTYCYITFDRKTHTYKLYQKFDSMYARLITGSFEIENDIYLGYVLSGTYDYGQGNWNNEYIVTDLLETGSMIWTVNGNSNDVSKYERCDKVPDEVTEEARTDQ